MLSFRHHAKPFIVLSLLLAMMQGFAPTHAVCQISGRCRELNVEWQFDASCEHCDLLTDHHPADQHECLMLDRRSQQIGGGQRGCGCPTDCWCRRPLPTSWTLTRSSTAVSDYELAVAVVSIRTNSNGADSKRDSCRVDGIHFEISAQQRCALICRFLA